MSYCRFSSDDWESDVYCWEDVGGFWAIAVAGNRVIGEIPKADHLFHPDTMDEYFEAHQKQMDYLDGAEREEIKLPHAGEYFQCGSPLDAAEQLKSLKKLGYHVPQYAIDALLEEVNET